jgi:multiple antibiotic resistance protein
MELLLNTFVALFIVIDPLGLAPMFIALTSGAGAGFRRKMAINGTLLASGMLLVFYFGGTWLLNALGIGIPAFRVAGGALLFLLAIDMVFARQSGLRSTTIREQREAETKQDISVFPLAFPLIAGPGALTTVLLMASSVKGALAFGAILAVLVVILIITLLTLLYAARIMKFLGETGTNVISRLFGLILSALAVQFVLDGIHASFAG